MIQDTNKNVYDVAIIGGGVASLMAGVYVARKKMSIAILTKNVGGQALSTNIIENFPAIELTTGADLSASLRKQVEKYGVSIQEGVEVEKIEKKGDNFLLTIKEDPSNPSGQEAVEAKTVIVATGKTQRKLNIPGEAEFENRGVVFCSICDAPLFGGKDVVVIGGGNSALESILDLQKYANKIYVLVRKDKVRGDELLLEKVEKIEKVQFLYKSELKEIKGDKFVNKVVYLDKDAGKEKELDVQGVFVTIGWIPTTKFLGDFLELNEYGEIVIDPKTTEASVKGVYAAGDVSDVKYKQFVIACAEGAKAALAAYEYINRL